MALRQAPSVSTVEGVACSVLPCEMQRCADVLRLRRMLADELVPVRYSQLRYAKLTLCDEPVQAAALAAGLRLKRLDKKLERQLVHAHCKALAAQLEAADDPAAALSIAVPLLAAQVLISLGTRKAACLAYCSVCMTRNACLSTDPCCTSNACSVVASVTF